MRNSIIIALCVAGIAVLATGCGNRAKKEQQKAAEEAAIEQARQDSIAQAQKAQKEKEAMATLQNLPDEPILDIVTDMGTIKVKLYSKTPKHRENFAKLALSGYYDGLLFHRVINGFMIQGGDPYTRDTSAAAVAKYGQGGPGYTIPAEFVPEYKHKKGALAAARRGDAANPKKESSGSQFYLVQDANACAQLDGEYTVFGETVEGLDVIDRIAQVATDKKDRPLHDVVIKQIKLDEKSTPKIDEKSEGSNEKGK
jgi:peptidyl-prolyl cis-trans isomerase B (cyclophilin B)